MLITLQQVSKTYTMGETDVRAVDRVDLQVAKSEFISIWGPSGSGKTTLLNIMGAIDHPTSGVACINGYDLATLSDNARSELRNRFIGFIFQRYNLIPVLSAIENVMIPLQIQGISSSTAEKKAASWLEAVGLAAVAGNRPDKMSGGQQQRVAVARALVTDPPLVIADEPTANLDSDTAMQLIFLMREINKNQGTTFVFSTHDQRLLDHVERRIRMQDGQIQILGQEVH
ncbi:MAG: ABC transporter ATP-binding protein [Pseudomonadota bacterium]